MSTKTKSRNGKMRQSSRMRGRMSYQLNYLKTGVFSALLTLGFLSYFQFFKTENIHAAVSGDYRSIASGNWNSLSTWEKYNGSSWVAATTTPVSADATIEITNGTTVTVTADVSADQILVNAGGSLVIASTKNLNIDNGTGTDITVNGTLTINGKLDLKSSSKMVVNNLVILAVGGDNSVSAGSTIEINSGARYIRRDGTMATSSGIWTVNSGGVFQQDIDGGNLPLATWNSGSTCEVTGMTGSVPGNLSQSFSNFTWNCTSQNTTKKLSGNLTTVNGDLTIVSTGSGRIRLGESENYTLNVGGNFNVQGGQLYLTSDGTTSLNVNGNLSVSGGTLGMTDGTKDNGKGIPTLNLTGDLNLSGGTLSLSESISTSAGDGIGTLNITGNLNQSGGTITETATTTATYGFGRINFVKSGNQSVSITSGTINNTINYSVNSSSNLNLGNSVLSGDGTFTTNGGSTLSIGSANGIATTGSDGNIQVNGSRTYSSTGIYIYSGSTAQNTGNGLPASIAGLTINNSNGVTLTSNTAVTGTLTLTTGNITTGSNTLTIGSSTSSLGSISRTSGHIIGNLKRWIAASATSNIAFPVGLSTYYKGLNYSFTSAPSNGGTITVTYTFGDPGRNGLNLFDSPDSIEFIAPEVWTVSTADGLAGGTYSLNATSANLPNVTDYTYLRLLRRSNGSSPWTLEGTHNAGTGNNTTPVVNRTGMTTLSGQLGIGSPSAGGTLPIKLISFKAKLNGKTVDLKWVTGAEINNSYFTIERSSDGRNFNEILRQPGAGNSTQILYYSASDDGPLPGVNYYRLKQTDYDGKFTYSEIRSVKFEDAVSEEAAITIESVSPNPFSDSFRVGFTVSSAGNAVVQIVNTAGQVMKQLSLETEKGYNNFTYDDVTNLPPGMYFVNIVLNGQGASKKIIKR